MDSKQVLVITYYFPPRPGVASLRLRGLAKYLPEFGWEPIILTPTLPGDPDTRFRVIQTPYPGDVTARWKRRLGLSADKGFQEQIGIPRALRESKASFTGKVINLAKAILAYPDEQKGWYRFAVSIGHELLKREHFNALLSSSGPATCHLIARKLKEEHKIPWIADLRDLWTQNHYYSYGTLRRLFERRLEIKTLSTADVLVTVSEPLAQKLRLLHRDKSAVAIPNGYDPDEVARSTQLTKEFTITYTGKLYQGKRDPTPLLRAIAELASERKIDLKAVKVRFYEDTPYWLEQEIKRYQLREVVSLHPKVPREVALQKQRESQILLLLNWNDPDEVGVYTGKVFEYLAARRPILAVGGPRGVVTELLEETGAGVHAFGHEHLKHVLFEFYQQYRAHGYVPYRGCEERIAKYSHREMARRFANVLDSVSAKGEAWQRRCQKDCNLATDYAQTIGNPKYKNLGKLRVGVLAPGVGYWGGVHKVTAKLIEGFINNSIPVDLILYTTQNLSFSRILCKARIISLKADRALLSRFHLLVNTILYVIPNLAKYIHRERPHAILSLGVYPTIAALVAKKIARSTVRIVANIHTVLSYEWVGDSIIKRRLLCPLFLGRFFHQVDMVVAVSRAVADDIIKLTGMPKGKVRVIYNPVVTPELFEKAMEATNHPWLIEGKLPVILGIGGSSKAKDLFTLIKAFNIVRKYRDSRLIVLAEEKRRPELKQLIKELSCENHVDMLGFVDNPYPYLKKSSVFVLSSKWEGLPTSLIEAMALGTPVIATDCPGGPREVLENGKWGRLVPVGDAETMAEAILETLDSPNPPPKEAWNPRFTLEQAVQDYLEILITGG